MSFLWFCVFFQYLALSRCHFDFDELTYTKYGMEIVEKPVVMDEEPAASTAYFQMTSVHGQHYQCHHPDTPSDFRVKEEEQVAMETGVLELLKPMADGPCLIQTKGWWTYEFCFGQEIKQYHMQDNKISGIVTSLGKFSSEFNWDDEQEVKEKKKSKDINRYHSQHYVNGTLCDLTGRPREAEVRFVCEEDRGDYVHRIDEPQTCSYLISVHTMKICHHPYLKPPSPRKPVSVTCAPLLNKQEYQDYLEALREEEEIRQKEKRKYLAEENRHGIDFTSSMDRQEFSLRDGQLVPLGAKPGTQPPEEKGGTVDGAKQEDGEGWTDLSEEEAVSESLQDLDKAFSEALTKSMQEIFGDQVEQNGQVKMKFKVFDDGSDLAEVMKNYMKKTAKGLRKPVDGEDLEEEDDEEFLDEEEDEDFDDDEVEEDGDEEGLVYTAGGDGHGQEGEILEDEENQALMDEFDENLREMAPEDGDLSHMAKYSEKIRHQVTEDFDDIIKEAQEELGEESPENVDPAELTRKLATTLNSLMERLKKAEQDLDEADTNLKDAMDRQVKATGEEEDEEEDPDWLDEDANKLPSTSQQRSSSVTSSKKSSRSQSNMQSSRGKFARPLKPHSGSDVQMQKQRKPSAKVLTDLYHEKKTTTSDGGDKEKKQTDTAAETSTDNMAGSKGDDIRGDENDDKRRVFSYGGDNDEEGQDSIAADGQGEKDTSMMTRQKSSNTLDSTTITTDGLSLHAEEESEADISEEGGTTMKRGMEKSATTSSGGELKTTSSSSITKKDKKVEVKIVHAAYYDEKEGTIHILPDEEGQLSNIMMAVLGDNRDQWKEEERQDQLEKGYNFKVGGGNKATRKKKAASSPQEQQEDQVLR